MKKYLFFIALLLPSCFLTAAEVKEISLKTCEASALEFSPEVKQKQSLKEAALLNYESSGASLYPSLALEAKGAWVSQVPELELGPLKMEYGDNWSYSAGPTLNYVLFDAGGRSRVKKGAYFAYMAKEKDFEFAKKTVLLDVRRAYFTVQQDLERMYFMDEQLKVAQKQLSDVNAAFKAGAKSNIDVYMAQKQKLRAEINIASARGALGAHLRELFSLTGDNYGIDASYPLDWRIKPGKGENAPSAIIKADPLKDTLASLSFASNNDFDKSLPPLAAAEDMAAYYENLAKSLRSSLYPTVALSAGAYAEYPNGPIHESVINGRAGASLRLPLFEGGKSRKEAAANQKQAQAALYEKQDMEERLSTLFYSSKSLLHSLSVQEVLTDDMVKASAKTASLTYQAYKAGSVTFLEVDNANLALLESRIALADIYVERLNRLAVMDNLGGGK